MALMEEHYFFCIKCGHQGIPIQRKKGHQHKKMHRKTLYCPYCKTYINHIECKNSEDIEEFYRAFHNGEYKEEAEESEKYLKEKERHGI